MRISVFVLSSILALIAAAGIVTAVAMVVHAMHVAHADPDAAERGLDVLAAIAAGILPFLIGTVALVGFTIVLALDHVREAARIQTAHLAAILQQQQAKQAGLL